MCQIFMLGAGGAGGTGVVGANSTAGGGGGGGSGAQVIINIPLAFLPDQIYISVPFGKAGAGADTYVCTFPDITTSVQTIIGYAAGGAAGSNASGGTGGGGGTAGAVSIAAQMPFGWSFASVLAGQAGTSGGNTSTGSNLTIPTTGLHCTGGTGAGGLSSAGVAGQSGGNFTQPGTQLPHPLQSGGAGSGTATNPAANGSHGYMLPGGAGLFFYGGTGAASTHGTATGAGLAQGSGGDGGFGCGGGGMGGALTASTAGAVGKGGNGLVIITCW